MAGRPAGGRRRARGGIDVLPSGAVRVRVYAGIDPVTSRRHYLTEVVEAGPDAYRKAEGIRDRLVQDVKERRNPRTRATVDQLLDRYFAQFDGSARTLELYRFYARKHISPFLGQLKVGDLDADILDSFYAELRRCRLHCTGSRFIEHRTSGEHECDERCGPHRCKPLGAWTVRHMHFLLSGAYRKAVRWRWVAVSPISQAEPPAAPKPNPQPPSPADAARILNEAWRDPDWGTLIWTAMTTGARRGEIAALRWSDVDLTEGRESLWLRHAISKVDGELIDGELKTHQQRRVALDPSSAAVLREHRARWESRVRKLDLDLERSAYVFSGAPDGLSWARPEGISQRYDRLAARLCIKTSFHKLRHYTATELIAAGVDVRTVAGRLGHAGGGTTTLRTYSAWVSEADQRAASSLGAGMPARPVELSEMERQQVDPRHPYERVAADLRRRVIDGEIVDGEKLPSERDVCETYKVSVSTARRATALLRDWAFLGPTGRRVTVPLVSAAGTIHRADPGGPPDTQYWLVTLRGPDGRRYAPRLVTGNPADPESFRRHLVGIARVETPASTDHGESWIANFELEVRAAGATQGTAPVLTLRWDR